MRSFGNHYRRSTRAQNRYFYRQSHTFYIIVRSTLSCDSEIKMQTRQPIDQMAITTEIGIVLKCLRQRKISIKLLLLRLYHMHIMAHI